MAKKNMVISVPVHFNGPISVHWKVRRRQIVDPTTTVCILTSNSVPPLPITAPDYGWVIALHDSDVVVSPHSELFQFEPCAHHVVVKDLCAECGANLRREGGLSGDRVENTIAKIPMVHAVPELHVSESVAAELAFQDEQSLLAARKLVLLVDLDQTVIHTTNESSAFRYRSVHRFCLPGSPVVYHTRFRPHLLDVLDRLSKCYEMHICTFGNRVYAHQLAGMIDPKRRFFSHRILSRDECFNPVTKSANLKALFPRGLHLVCIIDDRGEVWDWSPNLVHVKSYRFFPETGDINSLLPPAPPTFWSGGGTNQFVPSSFRAPGDNTFVNAAATQNKSCTVAEPLAAQRPADLLIADPVAPAVRFSDTESSRGAALTDVTHPDEESPLVISELSSNSILSNPTSDSPQDVIKTEPAVDCSESTDPTTGDVNPGDHSGSPDRLPTTKEFSERSLDAADENYLLRLQEILLSLHRAYFQEYDRLRAQQALSSLSSPSLSSTSEGGNQSESRHIIPPVSIPHMADIITKQRASVLGSNCHVTLSGLAPTHLPADRCLAGRIVRSLGAVLHAGLRLPHMDLRGDDMKTNKKQRLTTVAFVADTEEVIEGGANELSSSDGSLGKRKQVDVPAALDERQNRVRRTQACTTHLIACRRGTEKVRAAMEFLGMSGSKSGDDKSKSSVSNSLPPPHPRLHLISPLWLWDCHFLWQHVPESLYPLVQDFHPSDFDTEVEPGPGSLRYIRRHLRRHTHHGHHHHRRQSPHQLSLLQADHRLAVASGSSSAVHRKDFVRRHRHHNRHHHHHRHHSYHDHRRSTEISGDNNGPQLDISLVKSALDSIRAERIDRMKRRKHHQQSSDLEQVEDTSPSVELTVSSAGTMDVNLESSSEHSSTLSSEHETVHRSTEPLEDIGAGEAVELKLSVRRKSEDSQEAPSVSKRRRLDDVESIESGLISSTSTSVSPRSSSNSDQPGTSDSSLQTCGPETAVIKDAGEQDFEEEEECITGDDDLSSEGEDEVGVYCSVPVTGDTSPKTDEDVGQASSEEDDEITVQLRQYLPPPRALPLADNPLLHLPPQATTEMLAEIEEAVLEEEAERVSSVPVEAELYDPADLGLGDDTSSSSSMSATEERGTVGRLQPRQHRQKHSLHGQTLTSRLQGNPHFIAMEAERKSSRWQVQRELLLRRRRRASPTSVAKIDKKLSRINVLLLRENRRLHRRSADDLNLPCKGSTVGDEDDDDEEMCYDADYPKGWSPDLLTRSRLHRKGYHSRLLSPAIHSDPEPIGSWWYRDADVEEDDAGKEWNICPEGYDYADAERTRRLLSPASTHRDEDGCPTGPSAGRTVTRCLFGLEEDDEDDLSDDDEDDVDEDDDDGDVIEGEEDFADESWDPLREFM